MTEEGSLGSVSLCIVLHPITLEGAKKPAIDDDIAKIVTFELEEGKYFFLWKRGRKKAPAVSNIDLAPLWTHKINVYKVTMSHWKDLKSHLQELTQQSSGEVLFANPALTASWLNFKRQNKSAVLWQSLLLGAIKSSKASAPILIQSLLVPRSPLPLLSGSPYGRGQRKPRRANIV